MYIFSFVKHSLKLIIKINDIFQKCLILFSSLGRGKQNPTQPRFLYPMLRKRPIPVYPVRRCDVKPHKIQVHAVSLLILSIQSYFNIFQCLDHVRKLTNGSFSLSDEFFSHEMTLLCLHMKTVSAPMIVSCFFREYHTIEVNIWQLSHQICDIFHQIPRITTSTHDIFKLVPMRSDLFSYLNKMKPMCKQIQLHVSTHWWRVLTHSVDNLSSQKDTKFLWLVLFAK